MVGTPIPKFSRGCFSPSTHSDIIATHRAVCAVLSLCSTYRRPINKKQKADPTCDKDSILPRRASSNGAHLKCFKASMETLTFNVNGYWKLGPKQIFFETSSTGNAIAIAARTFANCTDEINCRLVVATVCLSQSFWWQSACMLIARYVCGPEILEAFIIPHPLWRRLAPPPCNGQATRCM